MNFSLMLLSLFCLSLSLEGKEYILKTSRPDYWSTQKNILRSFKVLGKDYLIISAAEFDKSLLKIGERVEENFSVKSFHYKKAFSLNHKSGNYYQWQWGFNNKGNNEPIRVNQRFPVPGVVGVDAEVEMAWDHMKKHRSILIAVPDTGVDLDHPDLKGQLWVNQKEKDGKKGVDDDGNGYIDDINGYDFVKNDGIPDDEMGHGTHVSGIIAALDNQVGVRGVLQNVKLMPIKFLDKKGRGSLEGTIKAMGYAIENKAKIINASWGSSRYSEIMMELIQESAANDSIIVAAAGNLRGRNTDVSPTYPACYNSPNIIAVASHNAQNYLSAFSSWGPRTIHIAAPGTNIISTFLNGEYKVWSGTSMAAPFVSGAIGLLMTQKEISVENIRFLAMERGDIVEKLKGKIISEKRLNTKKLIK
jgi:thermitase